jgi:hypothetical protein
LSKPVSFEKLFKKILKVFKGQLGDSPLSDILREKVVGRLQFWHARGVISLCQAIG